MPGLWVPTRQIARPPGPARLHRAHWQANKLLAWWTGAELFDYSGARLPMSGGTRGTVRPTVPQLGGLAESFERASSQYAYRDLTSGLPGSPIYPMTLAAWVYIYSRPAATGTNFYIPLSFGDTGSSVSRVMLNFNDDGSSYWMRLHVIDGSGGINAATSTTQWEALKLYHVVGRYITDTDYDIWINGVREGSQTDSKNAVGVGRVQIGARWNGSAWSGYLDGQVIDARLYTRTLSAEEIAELYEPRTRWDLYWRPSRRVFFEVAAGSTTLEAGSPSAVVVSAPAASLGLGAVTLAAGNPSAVVVSAPAASLGLGAVTLAAGNPSAVVVSVPAASLIQGGATLDAGLQPIVVSAPAAAVGVGAVALAAGTQPIVVSAPAASLGGATLETGVIRVLVGGTDRTSDTRIKGLRLTRRVGQAGTCEIVLRSATGAWRPGLMDAIEVWQPYRRVTDAAITSGDATLTSATAAFTAADVGAHVKIADAAGSSLPRYAKIASYTSATSVEIDTTAGATVSGKECLIGTLRFRGYLNSVPETRIERRADAREWRCQALDLVAVTRKLWMPTTWGGVTPTDDDPVMTHIADLVSACESAEHGIAVIQTGGTTFTWDTVAQWLWDAIEEAVDTYVADDGTARWWTVDCLGRVSVYAMDGLTFSGSDLSTANANILLLPASSRLGNEYFNKWKVTGYTRSGIGQPYRSHTETYENTTEQTALGGRVFEREPVDLSYDTGGGFYANAPPWIDLDADLLTYAAAEQAKVGRDAWVLEAETFEDGIEPGMIVTVDLAEQGMSSVDHYVQEVTSIWTGLLDPDAGQYGRWRHVVRANGQQAAYTSPWDRWRAWRP